MPSLADIIEASRGSRQYTNADLTPAARRKAAGVDEAMAEPGMEAARAPYVAPDGGRAEQDRLLAEAKGTLKNADPFATMLERAGNVGAEQSLASHQTPGEAAARSLGDTAVGVMKGVKHIPGDLLGGVLGLPGAIAHGYESLPEGLQAIVDPATWRGMPDAAKQQFMELADNPEEATRLFGGMIAAGPAGDLAGMGLAKAPGAVGGAISKVGRGMQAVGQSPLVEGTGLLRKAGAVLHPGVGTVLAAVGPEMLSGAGRAIEGFGGTVSNLPNSPALEALSKLANKDVGAMARDAFTPTPTADALAAGSVRATVDAAKGMVEKGQSRGQAAQRAGWPLAGDFELNDAGQPVNKYGTGDFGTHPGQNVEAHRPYEPAVRGKAGNVIRAGRGNFADTGSANTFGTGKPGTAFGSPASLSALDDLAGPTQRVQKGERSGALDALRGEAWPESRYYAGDTLDNPASQRYMEEQAAKNAPVADAAQARSDAAELERLMNARRAHQVAGDAQFDTNLEGPEIDLSHQLSPLDRLARLSRARSKARSFGSNSALAEGY
jgi:uncharacterized protein YjeT (DUF2065 family)